MSFKLGIIDNQGSTNLQTISDAVRINIDDNDRPDFARSFDDLAGIRRTSKATINLELDRVSQTDLGNLRKQMQNRRKPAKVYIDEPAAANQQQNFIFVGASAGPSDPKAEFLFSDLADKDETGLTEFSEAEYNLIDDFSGEFTKNSTVNKFFYMFFTFDLSAYFTTKSIQDIERLTLLLQDPHYRIDKAVDVDIGYQVHVKNVAQSSFDLIKRQTIAPRVVNSEDANQQFAALRPVDQFTKFADYLDSDRIVFRIRNIQELDTASSDLLVGSLNYAELLINGYGVVQTNSDNFTFRDTFTGAGQVGTIELSEI